MTMITESRAVARPLFPTGLFASIASQIATYRRSRRALRDLAAMDDHILRDIGLSRADVVRASVAEIGADPIAMLGLARARRMG